MVDRTLNKGLGAASIFALEGPEAAGTYFAMRPRPNGGYEFPSMTMFSELLEKGVPEDIIDQYLISGFGIMPNDPIDSADAQKTLERIRSLGYQPPAPTGSGTFSSGTPFPTLPPGTRQRMLEAERIAAMSPDLDIFAEEGPGLVPSLASVLEENVPAQLTREPKNFSALAPRTSKAPLARPTGLADTAAPVERAPAQLTREPEPMPEADPVESAFGEAMEEFVQASGQEVPEKRDMDFYRKQFAEATGLDISGKPDKRAALMAFGLALMQNRAGKGFNIGNILRSVGEAGQAAMPALQEAQKEAKAARMAAGKYALDQITAGESARAALAAEERAFKREVFLKSLELEAEAQKAAEEGVKFESVSQMEVQPGSSIKMTTGIDKDGNAIYVKPSLEASGVINGYNRYTKGQELSLELIKTLQKIDQQGPAGLQRIYSDFAGTLSNFGIPMPAYDPEAASDAAKADVYKNAMIVGFKRAITQESQVSDKDVIFMNEGIGDFTATTPIAKVIEAASLFYDYLGTQKRYYTNEIEKLSNPRYYAGRNEEFIDVQQQISDNILEPGTYIMNPSEAETQSGVIGSVDLTGGNK